MTERNIPVTGSPDDPKRALETLVGVPAFRDVYRCEFSYVHHTLQRLGVRPADLEDLTHDVFVAVLRHFSEYDSSRPVRPWLFGFAYRRASDYRKLACHRMERPEEAGANAVASGMLAEEALAEHQMRVLLLRALDRMDFEKRAVVVMHDLDGTPVPQMAEFFGVPVNTMYSRVRLAREQLERLLAELVGGEP